MRAETVKRGQAKTMTKVTNVWALAPLVLLFAGPAAAQTDLPCFVTQTDVDFNGAPDLVFRASTSKQKLVVNIDQTSTTVFLDCNGDGVFGSATGDINGATFGVIQTFLVRFTGNSDITFNFTGDLNGLAKNIAVKLGAKTNTVNIGGTPTSPSPGKLLANSALVVHIDGMVGPDTVNLVLPPVVDNSAIWFRAETGDANDHVNVYSQGSIVNGSIVDAKVDLGGSANTFNMVQNGTIANGTFNLDLQGGPGLLDKIESSLAGQIGAGGRFRFHGALGNGNDKFTQTFDLGNLQILAGGEARFQIDGDNGGDTITFTRNGTVGGPATLNAGLLAIGVNGGSGSDKITVDLGGGGFVTTGTYRLRLDGMSGNDTIVAASDFGAGSTPVIDVLIHGGTGADLIDFTSNNLGANLPVNYGPAGHVQIDGGYFTDVCTISGNALVHKRSCEK